MPEILSLIPARAGSKGVPNKNIVAVAGRPLIAWSIQAARSSGHAPRVVVSTDSAEFARVCRSHGAEVPFLRPAELAQDHVPSLDPVLHALDWFEENQGYHADYVLLLQPTSPLRTGADIDAAIDLALSKRADAVVSVTPVACHPYWTRKIDSEGRLEEFIHPQVADGRRQDLPKVFGFNGAIYLIRPKVLRRERTWYPEDTYAYVMPTERSLDVDTPWDVTLADMILRARDGIR